MSQELQNTLMRKRWQCWTFIGAFSLVLLAFVISNLIALNNGDFTKTKANGWHGFITGKPMRALAEDLRSTPFAEWLGQRQRELSWLVLHDTGPRVRQGCADWLFLLDELRPPVQAASYVHQRLKTAISVYQALSARNLRLVIALVPDKSRIENDHLCTLPRPSALAGRYDEWIAGLSRHGVEVIDLRGPLVEVKKATHAAYFQTDTHWNLAGAQAAAITVAEHLKERGFKPARPVVIRQQIVQERPYWGDLVRLAGLDGLPASLRPHPDRLLELEFELKYAEDGQALDAQALFGEVPSEHVYLIGTSFSRNSYFADFLAQALGSEVINLAKDGGGFAASMTSFLAQQGEQAAPAWIVWEMPERSLHEALTEHDRDLGWQKP